MPPKIIGLSGTNASGKDSIGHMLAERHGWLFVSVGDMLRDELQARGMAIERENLRALSTEWRHRYGFAVLINKAIERFNSVSGSFPGLVVASLRNPDESRRIHELGGIVVWSDANPEVRYERVVTRLRSTEDRKTFQQFLAEEQDEMQHSGDEAGLNMAGVKALADIFIENNGGDLEKFQDAAEKALKDYL